MIERRRLAVLSTAWLVAALALVVAPPASAQETAKTGIFHGVGIVKAIDQETGALTLDHDDIKGFMPAMEMMYRVDSPALSVGLRVGDRVAFDIDAGRETITAVKRLVGAN